MIKRKSILFICPAFFGYEISIKEALIENGFDVDYYDERTSNNSFYKAIFRIKKSLLQRSIDKYYRRISHEVGKKKYDYFFLIKGEVVPETFILEFRKTNPQAKLIYYTYDSFKNNNQNSLNILKYFNSCFSFDFEDTEKFENLKLKHLFYAKEFVQTNLHKEKRYSLSFVGTLHSNRSLVIKELFKNFDATYKFFYSPARWFFLLEKIIRKEYKNISINEVNFNKLNRQEVADIFKDSMGVLDIQRYGQSGLTMRTFEVLASGAILVTTNPHIRKADFYNEDQVFILESLNDEKNILKLKAHLNRHADLQLSLNNEKLKKYEVVEWVKDFFE